MRSLGGPAVTAALDVDGARASAPPSADPNEPNGKRNTAQLRRNVLLGAALAWALAITAVVLVRGDEARAPLVAAPSASPSAAERPLSVSEVYQTLLPSVVLIQTTRDGNSAAARDAKAMAISATGTGVIVNTDGAILTAAHVVEGADAIKVTYADGTGSKAVVAAADAKQDIAVLTPAALPETVVPAVLGGGVAVGDDVVAIGNPLGLTASTTSGVVSGLGRVARGESGQISGLIQFDAAVNPGSSGGPLINDRGQVVGVIVALANPTDADTFIGIGFAVPIGTALGAGEGDGRAPPL
jgi:S1-C subfamily serine protease